jgi:antirestriction protein ArdC
MANGERHDRFDAYQAVTDSILSQLDSGTIPWHKPWSFKGENNRPINAVSKRPYKGVNLWLLPNLEDNRWVTFNQAKQLGGNVSKGEKSTIVVFWKMFDTEETDSKGKVKIKKVPFLRYYRVFNVSQCEGLKIKPLDRGDDKSLSKVEVIEAAERLINGYDGRPNVINGFDRAYYQGDGDVVGMPPMDTFESSEAYYSTLFHEYTHSTGHKDRLNRHAEDGLTMHFGDESYSKEELVAEFGSAFLCAIGGFQIDATFKQSVGYIQNWSEVIKKDKKIIVSASSKAQKAVDYIAPDREEEEKEESNEDA